VINIEDLTKSMQFSGHLTNTENTVCGLDIRKAYPSFLANINAIPIFPILMYIENIIMKQLKIILIILLKYLITRVYGFVLNTLDETFKYKILYFRKPFKLEEVNFKAPVEDLFNNESIDSHLQKYIANKITGILELKRNKSHISLMIIAMQDIIKNYMMVKLYIFIKLLK
jgi:hypothetical protein